jgi:plastocyanin
MASVITRIIRKIIPQHERRCTACKRTLQQAINEQLALQKGCPLEHCVFKAEIQRAILESKTPEVLHWDINKIEIFENENITLSWEVLYAKRITISGLGKIPLKGNRTILLRRDTTYILTVQDYKNNIYETEQKFSIKVIPLPTIDFQCDKSQIEPGDVVTFRWMTRHICKVELSKDNLITNVTNRTDYSVRLTKNTNFKLIATALDNKTTIEKEIEIKVFPKPEIKYFKVSPEVVISSQPVTLSWKVENAKKIEINNGVGEVSAEDTKISLYDNNTLYKLTATGEISIVTKEVAVTVFPTPVIESLLVPMPDFESRINLNPIKISSPKTDVSINIPDFNFNPPQFTKPDVDLGRIKPLYKPKVSIFNFSKIYKHVKRKGGV